MPTDCRIFVLSNALMNVSGCLPDIICITQITWKMINSRLLFTIDGLISLVLRSFPNFFLTKTGCKVGPILRLRPGNCFRTALAATWTLKGRLILTLLLSSLFLYALFAEEFGKSKLLIAESITPRANVEYESTSWFFHSLVQGVQWNSNIRNLDQHLRHDMCRH